MSDNHSGPAGSPAGIPPSRSDAKSLQDAGADLKETAFRKAAEARDTAMGEVSARAEAAKAAAADEVSSIGSALRRASGELRSGSPEARAFASLADTLADAADGIRGKDFPDMLEDVSGFARRNPVAFLGGAALLGFAAVRMARASARNRTPDTGTDYGVPSYGSRAPGYRGAGSGYPSTSDTIPGPATYPVGGSASSQPGGVRSSTAPQTTSTGPGAHSDNTPGHRPVTPSHVPPGSSGSSGSASSKGDDH